MKITGTTHKMDKFIVDTLLDIDKNGCYTEKTVHTYKSDGKTAQSKYITDVFIKFDLQKGELPISSLRPIAIIKSLAEMDWIYLDQTSDLSVLRDKGVTWWDSWALDDDTIGDRYGQTVSNHHIIDKVIDRLENNPYNRRSIINLWQEVDLNNYAKLPPCAYEVIFDVRKIGDVMYLDCSLNQRSSDFLVAGMGINQMQYVSLQMKIATHLGMEVGTFSWHCMNVHVYDRHEQQAETIIDRYNSAYYFKHIKDSKLSFVLDKPSKTNFYNIVFTDFELLNYKPIKPNLSFDMAI